jgi:hypothetical protein
MALSAAGKLDTDDMQLEVMRLTDGVRLVEVDGWMG